MSKVASIARTIQGFERSAFIVFFAMIGLVACGEDTTEPMPQEYNLCDSDADCSEVTPRCRALDLSASGNVAKICVSECDPLVAELDFGRQCPDYSSPIASNPWYACVGINESGHLDPTSSDGVCARLCDDPGVDSEIQPSLCGLSLRQDERREGAAGVCARMEYDDRQGSLLFCLEPGTPPPPPIVPRYRDCDSSDACSSITPECRRSRYSSHRGFHSGFCTLSCEIDEDCPIDTQRREGPTPGRCLGVDAEGLFDPASVDKICFPGCGLGGCTRGAGTPEEKRGSCAHADPGENEEYGWFCF